MCHVFCPYPYRIPLLTTPSGLGQKLNINIKQIGGPRHIIVWRGEGREEEDLDKGFYMTRHSPSVDFRMADRDTRDFCILGPPLRSSSRRSRAFGKFCAVCVPVSRPIRYPDKAKSREGRRERV